MVLATKTSKKSIKYIHEIRKKAKALGITLKKMKKAELSGSNPDRIYEALSGKLADVALEIVCH